MMKRAFILVLALVPTMVWAQFAPEAGIAGTTAMHADSAAFVAWATGCDIERGPQCVDSLLLGDAYFGNESKALGKPGGVMDVVSLGDGGTAILTFDSPIYNGPGPDFAVFENAFHNVPHCFLELAFVEVSSDGENYFRFPAITYVPADSPDMQLPNGSVMDATLIHNFAGKYEANYGTPFDLDEVEDDALLDKNRITHVRLIDVVGTIDTTSAYATYDSQGHIINDPYPTPFYSSGFDLDAVGVIHDLAHFDVPEHSENAAMVYPNPVKDRLFVKGENVQTVEVYNLIGQQVMTSNETTLDLGDLMAGVYFVRIIADGRANVQRIVKQ